jgi:molybdopterin synthase catalytic subunit
MDKILVQPQPFDPAAEAQALCAGNPRVGALVSFVGLMRDQNQGQPIQAMTLEHYPGMTEKALADILAQARRRWDLEGATIIHRVGELRPEDPIVLVAVASQHRGQAFQACEFIMDYLKTQAPFWKKERTATGERWVDSRSTDTSAAARWAEPDPAPDHSPKP